MDVEKGRKVGILIHKVFIPGREALTVEATKTEDVVVSDFGNEEMAKANKAPVEVQTRFRAVNSTLHRIVKLVGDSTSNDAVWETVAVQKNVLRKVHDDTLPCPRCTLFQGKKCNIREMQPVYINREVPTFSDQGRQTVDAWYWTTLPAGTRASEVLCVQEPVPAEPTK